MDLGTRVKATLKSKHDGEVGTVVADYGNMIVVTAENQKYSKAHKNTGWDSKVFFIDSRYVKEDLSNVPHT